LRLDLIERFRRLSDFDDVAPIIEPKGFRIAERVIKTPLPQGTPTAVDDD